MPFHMRRVQSSTHTRGVWPCMLTLLVLAAVAPAQSATVVVRPDGLGDFPTIQAAIDAVQDHDTIVLLDGTYRGPGNRDLSYRGKAITIRSRSGSADRCVIDCQGSPHQEHRGFIFNMGETSAARLSGVTVCNGYSGAPRGPSGGAVHCADDASPAISNCVFFGNRSTLGGGAIHLEHASATFSNCRFAVNAAGRDGGALLCESGSVTLDHCTFESNDAEDSGGAVMLDQAAAMITDCSFQHNRSTGYGGACCASHALPVAFLDCNFVLNDARSEGGALHLNGSFMQIHHCLFSANTAQESAGAIQLYDVGAAIDSCTLSDNWAAVSGGGLRLSFSNPMITNTEFVGNHARFGGGMQCLYSAPLVINSHFEDNSAINYGGSVYATAPNSSAVSTFTGCRFSGNVANAKGGAIHAQSYSLSLTDCTFDGNSAIFGGALSCTAALLSLTRLTLHGNAAAEGAGAYLEDVTSAMTNTIIAFSPQGEAVQCVSGTPPTLTCCDLYHNAGGSWVGAIADQRRVNGNFAADPEYCDAAQEDFHLWNYSPCLQTGCGRIGAWPEGCWALQETGGGSDPAGTPLRLQLPSLFAPPARIAYTLASPGRVQLAVYDAGGRLLRTLLDADLPAGAHSSPWDGTDATGCALGSGAYFCRLTAGGNSVTGRLLLIR